jgi:hypothetical protein
MTWTVVLHSIEREYTLVLLRSGNFRGGEVSLKECVSQLSEGAEYLRYVLRLCARSPPSHESSQPLV